MADQPRLGSYDNTPIYTIKTVVQETGLTPATLRAWERRYGVLSPHRSEGGYRLYSERDIATLRWLKKQVDARITISRAVALLAVYHEAGEEPERAMAGSLSQRKVEPAPSAIPRSTNALMQDLLAALLAFSEPEAELVLSEAFALHPVEVVAEELITPTLVELGELWTRGEATIVQEHFATAFLRRRLTALFDAYQEPLSGPLAVTGSAPGEWHDVGILLVSIALRRHGWRVVYLGQNVPADQLVQETARLQPELICLSAMTRDGAEGLAEIYESVGKMSKPRPRLVFGGRAFNIDPELRLHFPGAYVGATARDLIAVQTR